MTRTISLRIAFTLLILGAGSTLLATNKPYSKGGEFHSDSGRDTLWNNFPGFFDHPFRQVKAKSFIAAEGGYTMDASSANNHFLFRIATKQDLNTELIAANAARQGRKNLLGIDGRASLTYYNLNKGVGRHDSLHYLFRYGFVDHGGIGYSDDLFKLIGQGNKQFEGDTAFGNGLVFKRMRFDYMDFGLIKFFPNRSNLTVTLGVARGIRLIDVDASRLKVYTAPYGTSMYFDLDVNTQLTPADKQGFQHVNGMGMQLGFDYKALLGPGGEGAIAVGARNLGFMQWKGSQYSKKDRFNYVGWYLPDPSVLSDAGAGQAAYDSIARIFEPDSVGFNELALLPAYVYAEYTMKLKGNQSLDFRFDKVLNMPMLPRVSIRYTVFRGNWYSATAIMTGGYSRFNVAQELGYRHGRHFAKAMLYGVHAMIAPKMAAGLGGNLAYMLMF